MFEKVEQLQIRMNLIYYGKKRGYVIPEDVRAVVTDVLQHRIGITYEAEAENVTYVDIINSIINEIEVP